MTSAAILPLREYKPNVEKLRLRFREWHVEALLNQAADLMDRCTTELREYRSLDFGFQQLRIDLEKEARDLALEEARLEFFEREGITLRERERCIADTNDEWGSALAEAEKLYRYADGAGQGAPGWTKAGQNVSEMRLKTQEREMEKNVLAKQLQWADADSEYGKKKLASRTEALVTRKQLSVPGGPLSLDWQRDLLLERLHFNLEKAMDRIIVAQVGLERLYGRRILANLPGGESPVDEVISKALLWIREAVEFLVAYGQLDQAFTRVVSVRALVGEVNWAKLGVSGTGATMRIPASAFNQHENVRLRGLAAALIGDVGRVPWSVTLTLPLNAIYVRESHEFNVQQDLPDCLLGRVENRRSPRAVEVCGLVSLASASPIGAAGDQGLWHVDIEVPSGSGEARDKLEDVVLEIGCVGIPTGRKGGR